MIKRSPTKQAKSLYEKLRNRGIDAIMEYFDGHKCVDIGIPNAHLYIEVDGPNHLNSSEQIEKDFKRDHYSEIGGFHTMHISNYAIDDDAERIAEAISMIAQKRKEKILRLVC
jgi:very-short-patch-repair endonuclease